MRATDAPAERERNLSGREVPAEGIGPTTGFDICLSLFLELASGTHKNIPVAAAAAARFLE